MSRSDPLGLFSYRLLANASAVHDQGSDPHRRRIFPEAAPSCTARPRHCRSRRRGEIDRATDSEPPGSTERGLPSRERLPLLYRAFYYDARPYDRKAHTLVSKRPIDYAWSPQATFRDSLFDTLRRRSNLAVRLGEVRRPGHRSWILKEGPQQRLLSGDLTADDLSDDDFEAALRQKGVDMRIGLDIASITLKRQAGMIILIAGDSDFVPAAKLARREGMQFILDPLWQQVPRDLFEHIDGLRSGFPRPRLP